MPPPRLIYWCSCCGVMADWALERTAQCHTGDFVVSYFGTIMKGKYYELTFLTVVCNYLST